MSLSLRTFEADTITEALLRVRVSLGPKALILDTKMLKRPSWFGLRTKKRVQVVAGLSETIGGAEPRGEVTDEIQALREELKELRTEFSSKRETPPQHQAPPPLEAPLKGLGLDEGSRAALRKQLGSLDPGTDLRDRIVESLRPLIPTAKELKPGDGRVVALVGPTGVGKTTTIAKLAAIFALKRQAKVALISIDTFRIAAIEQLRLYAEIIGTPIETAHSPQDLHWAIERHRDKDFIFIDTAGHSPFNAHQLTTLRGFLQLAAPDRVFLVQSLSANGSEIDSLIGQYRAFGPDALILTKLDETARHGSIVNILRRTGLPAAYVTTGQNVPQDIEQANAEQLADIIGKGLNLEAPI